MNLATTFTTRNPAAGKTLRLTTRGRLPRARVLTLGLLLTAPLALAAGEGKPQAVSPGSPTTAEPLAESCPTFSWSGVAGAAGYELVLYQLSDRETLETVLQVQVAGDSRAWTPSAALCPASGSQYAWAVRAVTEEGVGAWSEPLLFTTAGLPSDDEVRHALETLRRYQSGSDPRQLAAGEQSTAASQPPGPASAPTTQNLQPRTDLAALGAPTIGTSSWPHTVTTPSSFSLNLSGDLELGGFVFQDGAPFIHNQGGSTYANTAVGLFALVTTTPAYGVGEHNTASGFGALYANTTGHRNTASGSYALVSNGTGSHNTAGGFAALLNNTTGFGNTALGSLALPSNQSGYLNTAIGTGALYLNAQGDRNSAVGRLALRNNSSGSNNTAVGPSAGYYWDTGDHNIALGSGSLGASGETGTIRIGGNDLQTKTYIEGISNAIGTFETAVCVFGDQLGPCSTSSARFKQDVEPLADLGRGLAALRPVSFRYKSTFAGREDTQLRFGLIAEEVAEVFPSLVTSDAQGRPHTVRYDLLTPLLLAEIQRQEQAIQRQQRELDDLRGRLEKVAREKGSGEDRGP